MRISYEPQSDPSAIHTAPTNIRAQFNATAAKTIRSETGQFATKTENLETILFADTIPLLEVTTRPTERSRAAKPTNGGKSFAALCRIRPRKFAATCRLTTPMIAAMCCVLSQSRRRQARFGLTPTPFYLSLLLLANTIENRGDMLCGDD